MASPASSKSRKPLKELHGTAKIQYIWDYYKVPMAVACILIYIVGYTVYGHVTHKDRPIYVALVNITAGDQLKQQLSDGFLEYAGLNPSKNQAYLYTGLYLTANPNSDYYSYTYASRMKILAALDAEQMDIVLADQEAFDAFAEEGYLYDLNALLAEREPDLYRRISSFLVRSGTDGGGASGDTADGGAASSDTISGGAASGLDLSQSPLIRQAGFDGSVYLGVIGNSPRLDMVINYLEYLFP